MNMMKDDMIGKLNVTFEGTVEDALTYKKRI